MKRKGPASSAKAGRVAGLSVSATNAADIFAAFDSNSALPQEQVDPEINACFKLLMKKDYTTKYKALKQLLDMLPNKSIEDLKPAVSVFGRQIGDFIREGSDFRVRDILGMCITEFVFRLQKQATSVLGQLLPIWIMLMFDVSKSVQVTAQQGFAKCFKEDKRRQVLKMFKDDILSFLNESLGMSVAALADYLNVAKDDTNADRHERMICSSLASKAEVIVALELSDEVIQHKFLTNHSYAIASACVDAIIKTRLCVHKPLTVDLAKAAFGLEDPKHRLKLLTAFAKEEDSKDLLKDDPSLESFRKKFINHMVKEKNWTDHDVEQFAFIPWDHQALEKLLPTLFHLPETYYTLLCIGSGDSVDPMKALAPVYKFLDGECPGLARVLKRFGSQLKWDNWDALAWKSLDDHLLEVPVTARWIDIMVSLRRELWNQRVFSCPYDLLPKFIQHGRTVLKQEVTPKQFFENFTWKGDAAFVRAVSYFGEAVEQALEACPAGFRIIAEETDWNLSCFEDVVLKVARGEYKIHEDESEEDKALNAILRLKPERLAFQKKLVEVLVEMEQWHLLEEYEQFSSEEAVNVIQKLGYAPKKVLRQVQPMSTLYPVARNNSDILSSMADIDPEFCCSKILDVDIGSVIESTARWFGSEHDFLLVSRMLHANVGIPTSYNIYPFVDYAWQKQDWLSLANVGQKNLGRRFIDDIKEFKDPTIAFHFLYNVTPLDRRKLRMLRNHIRKKFEPSAVYLYAAAALELRFAQATSKRNSQQGLANLIESAELWVDAVAAPASKQDKFNKSTYDPIIQDADDDDIDDLDSCPEIDDESSEIEERDSEWDNYSCPEISDDEGMEDDDDENEEDVLDTWLIDMLDKPAFWRYADEPLQLAHICFAATVCEISDVSESTKSRLWPRVQSLFPCWEARRVLKACPDSPAWNLVLPNKLEDLPEVMKPDELEDLVKYAKVEGESKTFLLRVADADLMEGPYAHASAMAFRKVWRKDQLTEACQRFSHPILWTLYTDCRVRRIDSADGVKIDDDDDECARNTKAFEAPVDEGEMEDMMRDQARGLVKECMYHGPFEVPKSAPDAVASLTSRDDADEKEWALRCLFGLLLLWPQLVRTVFEEDMENKGQVLTFCKSIAPPLIHYTVTNAQKVIANGKPDGLMAKLRYLKSSRQATIMYKRDELSVELSITFEKDFPLTPPKITPPDGAGGIPKGRFRNWLLACQNGITDGATSTALLAWVKNFHFFFDGLEDCPICYSVVHGQTGTAPRKPCSTCKYKFHAECLSKWFKKSHKTNCPLCNQPF